MRTWTSITLGTLVWLWTAYTLYVVGRFGGAVVVDPDTTARIMGVRNDGVMHSAVGLTYHGWSGAALVVVELLLVVAALVLSLRSAGWSRVVGPALLAAWAALWLGNALWLQSLGWDHPRSLYVSAVALPVIVAWAFVRRRPRVRPVAA